LHWNTRMETIATHRGCSASRVRRCGCDCERSAYTSRIRSSPTTKTHP